MADIESRTAPKGLLDLLVMLEDGPKTFSQLKVLNLSPSTILSRLREAQEMGLVDQKLYPKKGKRSEIRYLLSKDGVEMLKMYGSIRDRYTQLRMELQSLQEEIRTKEKEMKFLLSTANKASS